MTSETAAPTRPRERLREEADFLQQWLFDAALPLWWSRGADHRDGGFEELLGRDAVPVAAPRRARVQARQIYVYATAGAMGWTGPWREAMNHGLNYFFARYARPDGLVRPSSSASGGPSDENPMLYDQAFGLLAMAAAETALGAAARTHDRARALLASVDARFGFGGSGYRSGDAARPFQSNPQMHLLEACLAWMAHHPSPLWSDVAARISALAMTRLIDTSTGALREFFDGRWAPAAGRDGSIVEPGHQFEWGSLLYRWGGLTGTPAAMAVANRLLEIGAGPGVDRARNVAINALDDRLAPSDTSARLWPQTERIKAMALAAEFNSSERDRYLAELIDGVAGLKRYLLPNGTWRDKLTEDDRFVEEPAPASSLYHIVGAVDAVSRAAKPV